MIHIDDSSTVKVSIHLPRRITVARPRNFITHPQRYYSNIPKSTRKLYTDDEIQAAIKRKNAERSWLSDLRDVGDNGKPIPSRDQDGYGYCWAHSTVCAMLLARARDGQPYADL